MRELIVLLKGNDIWLYVTTHLKAYPESHVVLENGPRNYRSQIIIAFGPPGEYGEESLTVTIDHGQPWMCDFSSLPFRSEEHTSELQSLMRISYAVFCLKQKKQNKIIYDTTNINDTTRTTN